MTNNTNPNRHVTIVLPSEIQTDNNCQFIQLLHPKTELPATFLYSQNKNALYELTAINGSSQNITNKTPENEARSLMFSTNWVESDSTIITATPFNPLYLILNALVDAKERFVCLEDLHDQMEQHCQDKPESASESENIAQVLPFKLMSHELMIKACNHVEEGGVTMYRLNESKLIEYLNNVCERVIKKAPESLVNNKINEPLQPIDIQQSTPDDVKQIAMNKLGVGLIASYLSNNVTKIWLTALNFNQLDEYIAKLARDKTEAQLRQEQLLEGSMIGKKRSIDDPLIDPTKKSKQAKKAPPAKPQPKSNKSITTFFKKK